MSVDPATRHAADLDYYRSNALFLALTPIGEVIDSRDLLLANTGGPFAQFNIAFLKPPMQEVDAAIDRGEQFFGDRGFPFRFGVRDDGRDLVAKRLLDAGYIEQPAVPTFVLPEIAAPPALPAGLEIVEVVPGPIADEYRGVAERGFGFPAGMGQVALSDAVLTHPDATHLLGRVDGEPVATSLLQMSNEVAGIYFVACEENHRRKGYGEALTWAAAAAGAQRGARVASLQASEMGRPVYERMGFERTGNYHYFETPGGGEEPTF